MKKTTKKNCITKILATLITILIIITPATAISTTNPNQTATVPINEYIGFSLSTNNIAFKANNLATTLTTPTYTLTNRGNVNITLTVKANNDFNGPETLTLTEGYYTLICQNTITNIDKTHNNIFKTGLQPQRQGTSTLTLHQTYKIPYGVTPGTYKTTITYTAIKTT